MWFCNLETSSSISDYAIWRPLGVKTQNERVQVAKYTVKRRLLIFLSPGKKIAYLFYSESGEEQDEEIKR
jgi:hypothetical protein